MHAYARTAHMSIFMAYPWQRRSPAETKTVRKRKREREREKDTYINLYRCAPKSIHRNFISDSLLFSPSRFVFPFEQWQRHKYKAHSARFSQDCFSNSWLGHGTNTAPPSSLTYSLLFPTSIHIFPLPFLHGETSVSASCQFVCQKCLLAGRIN